MKPVGQLLLGFSVFCGLQTTQIRALRLWIKNCVSLHYFMDIYTRKSRLKIYLALLGLAIVAISMVYTGYLAEQLAAEERAKIENWVLAQELVNDTDDEDLDYCNFTLHTQILESNTSIPVIWVSDGGSINVATNFGAERDTNMTFLEKELESIKGNGKEPIKTYGGFIYYKDSRILTLLQYLPIVQFILIGAFITFGYLGFSSSRRAEQNRVWVGMAKETAHQLGTPISAIVAWIEHLKLIAADNEEVQEVVVELNNDVKRLDLVADRFSKIGSEPTLESINIYEELEAVRNYMQKRAPRKVKFDFPSLDNSPLYVKINSHLFDWVVENLMRNALDAMEGKGTIGAKVTTEKGFVNIDLFDTGKGIPASKFKTIFQPGYTTKKRGWGLGLSLAKRIIESYHSGKIFVKKSVINEGTTFTIKLPFGE